MALRKGSTRVVLASTSSKTNTRPFVTNMLYKQAKSMMPKISVSAPFPQNPRVTLWDPAESTPRSHLAHAPRLT